MWQPPHLSSACAQKVTQLVFVQTGLGDLMELTSVCQVHLGPHRVVVSGTSCLALASEVYGISQGRPARCGCGYAVCEHVAGGEPTWLPVATVCPSEGCQEAAKE